jgi:hypothetical protein
MEDIKTIHNIKAQIPISGNIIADRMVGNTHILLNNEECCNKGPKDKAGAIKRMEVIAANAIAAGKYKPKTQEELLRIQKRRESVVDVTKVKGYDNLSQRQKEIFEDVFYRHNACFENPENKKGYTPVNVERDDNGVKVTFKNKCWLRYYANGTWG